MKRLQASGIVIVGVMLGSAAAHGEAPSTAVEAHRVVTESLSALSVTREVRAVASIRVKATFVTYDIVENDHPGAPWYVTVSEGTITDDIPGRRMLTETHSPESVTAPAQLRRVVLTRSIAQTDSTLGTEPPPSWETQNPLRALLLADTAADLRLRHSVLLHDHRMDVVAFRNGPYPVRLLIDALTHLPAAVEATVSYSAPTSTGVAWNSWGDVAERTEYMNWNVISGIRYPFQWDVFRNDNLNRTTSISSAEVDTSVSEDDFRITPRALAEAAKTQGETADNLPLGHSVLGAPAVNLPIREIAPGVVQIPGSWYVTLVRQDKGVVVIDAPISAGYSTRVLAEAARRFPGSPITAVVASTGFYWHIAGLREYAARGIPIYVRDRNVPVVRRLIAAPRNLVPDELSRAPKVPIIRSVSIRTTIGSGQNALVILPISQATEDMLMTWLPSARILHTAEMVQPFGPNDGLLYPESLLELHRSVKEAGLDVAAIIGMHVSPRPWSDVEAALGKSGG